MPAPKRKIERSEDQKQISISLPDHLLKEIDHSAQTFTRGNRSKLIAAALIGLFKTNKMDEMVKEGLSQSPLTQAEMLKAAFALIATGDPKAAKILKKSDIIKTALRQP